jgi:LmbE family N-acetylglucosaminyl deacetylase
MPNILVIGPHPDDQELAMGGTIALLAAQGHRVHLLDVTDGSPTPQGDRATRLPEAQAALAALQPTPAELARGAQPITRSLLDLPNRRVEHTIENRHKLAGVIRAHQASVLFIPYFEDAHPDHLAVTRCAEDARFDAKLTKQPMPGDQGQPPIYPTWLFYYFATHLRIMPSPSFIIDTTDHAHKKHAAVAAYASQFANNPANRSVTDWLKAQDAYIGSRVRRADGTTAPAAEAFFTREPLALNSLAGLTGLS